MFSFSATTFVSFFLFWRLFHRRHSPKCRLFSIHYSAGFAHLCSRPFSRVMLQSGFLQAVLFTVLSCYCRLQHFAPRRNAHYLLNLLLLGLRHAYMVAAFTSCVHIPQARGLFKKFRLLASWVPFAHADIQAVDRILVTLRN
jgi:hypothetical protein